MDRPEAYPITYAVLGLLAFMGPMTGYDLKRFFDHMLSPMWNTTHSQIYKELRRMNELGWVSMEREEQETRPDRKIYAVTAEGQAALGSWQNQPPTILQIRDELLLKIMFGTFATPEALASHIRAAIAYHEQRLLEYRQNLHYMPTRGIPLKRGAYYSNEALGNEGDAYFGLVGRFAIAFEKTYIEWLYETLAFIENGQAPPSS